MALSLARKTKPQALAVGAGSPLGALFLSGGTYVDPNSPQQAEGLSAAYACTRVISEDIAKIPLRVIRKDGDKREIINDHPITIAFKSKPNPNETSYVFRREFTRHVVGWGVGYAEIIRNGDELALVRYNPDRVKAKHDESGKYYEIQLDGTTRRVEDADMLTPSAYGGMSVVRLAHTTIKGGLTQAEYITNYMTNAIAPGGILTTPERLSKEAKNDLAKSMRKAYSGKNAGRSVAILDEGVKLEPWSISPADAELLQASQYTVEEICRWYRVQPHKIMERSRAAGWSTLEARELDHVRDTLMPWLVMFEQEYTSKLLSSAEIAQGYYIQHNVDSLLRADIRTRTAALKTQAMFGTLTVNEWRAIENRPPVEGGDVPLVPLNVAPLEDVVEGEVGAEQAPMDKEDIGANIKPVVIDAANRLASRMANIFERKHKSGAASDVDITIETYKDYYGSCFEAMGVDIQEAETLLGDMLSRRLDAFYGSITQAHVSNLCNEIRDGGISSLVSAETEADMVMVFGGYIE